MLEDYLVQYCAPTLAGIKTANLFNCPYGERESFMASVRCMNHRIRHKGVRIVPLRFSEKRALIYIYRPGKLAEDLGQQEAVRLLAEQGYDTMSCDRCICQLGQRLRQQKEFPHEIGLFLGYPPEDVCGFIENQACGFKCVGCWKVYGDEDAAKKKFAQYKKCTSVYCDRWAKKRDIERLTVAS